MRPGETLSMQGLLPPGVTVDDAYVLMAGIMSFIVIYIVGSSFFPQNNLSGRVKALQERRKQLRGEAVSAKRTRKTDTSVKLNLMRLIVTRMKLLQKEQVGQITQFLVSAGYRSRDAIIIFTFFKLVTPIVFTIIAFILAKLSFIHPAEAGWKWLIPLAAAYFGAKLPVIMIVNARTKRYDLIQKALSDTLDLMLICAEAGLSLSATLDRVSRELGLVYPEMAEELALTSIELGFLPERKKALTNLSERVQIGEVRGIANVLIQTEKYGTPIAQALRALSSEFRTQRMLRAEQKAAKLPAIMTIPMIVFILPTLFIVVISPAIIKLMDTNTM